MIQVNILEQLRTLYNIFITNKNVLIISIISLVSLLALIIGSRIKNKKIMKFICLVVYIGIIGTLIYFFYQEILTFIDYLMNNLFIFLFFPNLAVYTLVLIIINILLIRSVISKKEGKVKKIINIIFFILFNIIFYLIIDNVITNHINVYEQLNIYTNNNLLILIQLSMNLFLVWLIVLLIFKISDYLITPISYHKKQLVFDNTINIDELNNITSIEDRDYNKISDNVLAIKEIGNSNIYNECIDIIPVKKKNNKDKIISSVVKPIEEINNYVEIDSNEIDDKPVLLTSMEALFNTNKVETNNHDMDILFNNSLNTIMSDIEKLKYNPKDTNQIRKIYDEISFNKDDLSLNDYNNLIKALIAVKNSN